MQTIKIKWGDNPEHIIRIHQGSDYSGYCITHNEPVTENTRCSHFPCQSAMWSDLWRIQLHKV